MARTLVMTAVMYLAITCVTTGLRADDGNVLFAEPFATKLSDGWSWVRESPKDWRVDKGALELHILPGYLHEHSNSSRNILLRSVPAAKDKSFAFEVQLTGNPQLQFEHAGPVYYVDDDNYVSLFQESLGGKSKIQMVIENGGKPKHPAVANEAKTVWLRLQVTPKTIIGLFRVKETDPWEKVGEGERPTGLGKVGLTSGGGGEKSERQVRIQSFRVIETK